MTPANLLHSFTALCLLLALIVGGQLHATTIAATAFQNPWPLEQSYTDKIEVFGRQVPLPGGSWVVAGVGVDPLAEQEVRAYGVMAVLVLFKLDGQQVTAFALIHANAIPIDGGWGVSQDCKRTDLPFARIYEDGELHTFCSFVKPITTAIAPSTQELSAWRDAVNLAHKRNWQLPVQWWEAGLRICDWHDVLDIRYAFAPETLVQYAQGPKLDATPEVMLTRWIDRMLPAIYTGFKRSLTAQLVPSMPGVPEQQSALENWNNAAQQAELSDAAYSFWKVVVNRVVNMTTSIGVVYLFIGNIYLASGMQAVSSSLHGPVNYVEELLWNTYGPQRLRHAHVYDFTYVGREDN